MNATLSPKHVAKALGVSESSVKRWADEGRIQAVRTAGGHRRIAMPDAIRFIREAGLPVVAPEMLGFSEWAETSSPDADPDTAADRLFHLLQEGRHERASALILSLYVAGDSVAAIADGPIRSAMHRVGTLWRQRREGIFLEHRATESCIRAVRHLDLVAQRRAGSLVAVGGSPMQDPYAMPTLLASVSLRSEGIDAVNLGANTPFEAFVEAVKMYRPQLVWLSITHVEDQQKLKQALGEFSEYVAGSGAKLAVGGQGLPRLYAPKGDRVLCGQSMAELVAFASGLRAVRSAAR